MDIEEQKVAIPLRENMALLYTHKLVHKYIIAVSEICSANPRRRFDSSGDNESNFWASSLPRKASWSNSGLW